MDNRSKNLTLRDVSIKLNREKIENPKNNEIPKERTLLIVGNKCSGKTNIINQLIEKDKGPSNPTSTYLLEYRYCRQSGKGMIKDVCHIWEVGGETTFSTVLPNIIKSWLSVTVVLVLDLSKPETIIYVVETLLEVIKVGCVNSGISRTETKNPDMQEEDVPHLTPFPVPLVVVAGKYDAFENIEPLKKKVISQYLRCLCHIYQADLLYYCNSDNRLIKNVRDSLLHHAFGVPLSKNIVNDHTKPLRIPAGFDSFRNIQGPAAKTAIFTLETYKNTFLAYLKPEMNKVDQIIDDPAADAKFYECAIDDMYRQKLEELKRTKEEDLKKMYAIKSIR